MPGPYTLRCLLELGIGMILLPLLVVPLGYLLGHASGMLGFRRLSASGRFALALILGSALTPLCLHASGRILDHRLALLLPLALWVPACRVWFLEKKRANAGSARPPATIDGLAAAVIIGWTLLGIPLLVDLDDGAALQAMGALDYPKHALVTDSIVRTGLPPLNPSFQADGPASLYYYYLWHVPCASLTVLSGGWVSPRMAAAAASRWTAIALGLLVLLSLDSLASSVGPRRARQRWAALFLCVSGLDLILVLAQGLITQHWPRDSDSWNELVSSWFNSCLYSPHHVGSLVAWWVGLLVLSRSAPADGDKPGWRIGIAAGCFAAATGMSVWVSIVGWVALGACALVSRFSGSIERSKQLLMAGALAGVLCLPFVTELARAKPVGEIPIALQVRRFFPLDGRLADWGLGTIPIQFLRLVALPLNYGLELGAAGVLGVLLACRTRRPRPRAGTTSVLVVVAIVSLVVCSFVRSKFVNNVLGWRGLLFAQLGGVLAAGVLMPALARGPRFGLLRRTLGIATLVGLGSFLHDSFWRTGLALRSLSASTRAGEQERRIRDAYEFLLRNSASDAIVQANPRTVGYAHARYSQRQTRVGDPEFGTLFGIDEDEYRRAAAEMELVFGCAPTEEEFRSRAAGHAVDYWIVLREDPLWEAAWLGSCRAAFRNGDVVVLASR